ncbi:MAG: hypothetical protein H6825_11640 [Planctomycetes bacterium]|nr:hypothetical protein [Planctomycetota bacterium]
MKRRLESVCAVLLGCCAWTACGQAGQGASGGVSYDGPGGSVSAGVSVGKASTGVPQFQMTEEQIDGWVDLCEQILTHPETYTPDGMTTQEVLDFVGKKLDFLLAIKMTLAGG